jgi:DNA-binding NtrC family response regulator
MIRGSEAHIKELEQDLSNCRVALYELKQKHKDITSLVDQLLQQKAQSHQMKASILEPDKQKAGKLRHSLLMQTAINELIRVREFGAIKYPDPESWKKVATIDYFDAIHRHLAAWQSGEKCADDSGLHHMAHVMCNAMFIVAMEMGEGKCTL